MRYRFFVPLAATFFALSGGAQDSHDELPRWHPLHPDRVADIRTAPQPTTSEAFYRRISNAYELLEEEKPEEALESIERIRPDRVSNYEQAQLYRTLGFIYLQLEREDEAFKAFERCLERNALPTPIHQSIVYSVVGYHAGNERYDESNSALLRWFRYAPDPSGEAYAIMGANFAQQGMMREALPFVVRANQIVSEPNSNWRDLQLAIHVDLEQFKAAIELVHDNIGIWPENLRNYMVLAGLYTETGDDEGALAALSVAWHRDLMKSPTDILELVRLNLILEAPVRAGFILTEAMDRGYVEENFDNLRLLLNSWTMAREHEQAVNAIDKLARMAEHGEYYYRKALLLNETHDWKQVVESCQLAIEKGGLDQPGAAWLLQGVALIELGQLEKAISAFERAEGIGNESVRRDAEAWISYVQDRIRESS